MDRVMEQLTIKAMFVPWEENIKERALKQSQGVDVRGVQSQQKVIRWCSFILTITHYTPSSYFISFNGH